MGRKESNQTNKQIPYVQFKRVYTFIFANTDLSFFENSVDPGQLAYEEAIRSESILCCSLIENTYL